MVKKEVFEWKEGQKTIELCGTSKLNSFARANEYVIFLRDLALLPLQIIVDSLNNPNILNI